MDMPVGAAPPITHSECRGVGEIIARIGDKWTVQVVMTLFDRAHRFNEVKRNVEGISQQMLVRTLRLLERDGLVVREVRPTTPPQVLYALTDLGRSLAGPVRTLGDWARSNMVAIRGNRSRYDGAA